MPVSHRPLLGAVLASCLVLATACGGGDTPMGGDPTPPAADPDWLSATQAGGDTTNSTGNQSSTGFDTPAPNLAGDELAMHLAGDKLFEVSFIKAPSASFPNADGLGPAFNSPACINCHTRDGRGNYTQQALLAGADQWTQLGSESAMFLRISLSSNGACVPAASNDWCAPTPVPGFGDQLFHRGVLDLRPDSPFTGQADFYVRFATQQVQYADGTTVTLRKPVYDMRNPYDAPGEMLTAGSTPRSRLLQPDVVTSPRMGLPMFGLGLLEAIPEADILALADPDDANHDGISGRANWVYDIVKARRGDANPLSLGRFGWKASTPSVLAQGAGAYHGDMGLTNYLFPTESLVGTPLYSSYRATHPDDDGQAASGYEVNEHDVKQVMFYSNTLAVPARRNVNDAQVLQGARLFNSTKCVACHVPTFTTGAHPGLWGPSGVTPVSVVQGQKIHPFTDLLLHDMGDGLADGRSDFQASGTEWRTRPLWGIGLTETVNPLAGYLHDGRARSLEEAILWHGGEAESQKEAFRSMSAADRAALIAFLKSL